MSLQTWRRVCMVLWLLVGPSALFADPPVTAEPAAPGAVTDSETAGSSAPLPTTGVIVRGISATQNARPVAATTPPSPRDSFQQRLQQEQQRQRLAELEAARRPTAWQLQNPSGQQNRMDESQFRANGYVSPNTYFGAKQRPWSNLSAPVYERELPPSIRPVPPLTQTQVMVAPYSYWGQQNNRWNMVHPSQATPHRLGGWNLGPGW